jgi:uncharacterized membrane protein
MRIPRLTPRSALLGLHIGALMFGLTGIFGKLILAGPLVIVFGRALFGALALGGAFPDTWSKRPSWQLALLVGGGLLLCAHWLTFFLAVKVGNVAVATLGFASFPAFTVLLEGALRRTHPRQRIPRGGAGLHRPGDGHAESGSRPGRHRRAAGACSGLLFALLSLANRVSVRGVDPIHGARAEPDDRPLPAAPGARRTAPGARPRLAVAGPARGVLAPASRTACSSPACA